ncbi:BnaC03g14460D [Brassica napus]|uniref:(rape) hypothetical protein n=1 Tax=Brassica napus TaxID=3708 RepID=A0A078I3V5_BRANA|nr:unnamed protein product [Brassica napus]CDY43813.1 BnaC03g14460D [Brassica napus]
MKSSDEESGFREALEVFIQNAEGSVVEILEEGKRIMALVKATGDYFHGKAGKDEGLRLFVIVRDFLIILDKSCKEVREAKGKQVKMARKQGSTASSASVASEIPRAPSLDPREKLFPAITERRHAVLLRASDGLFFCWEWNGVNLQGCQGLTDVR